MKFNSKTVILLDLLLTVFSVLLTKIMINHEQDDFAVMIQLLAPLVLAWKFVHVGLAFCVSTLLSNVYSGWKNRYVLIFSKGFTAIVIYLTVNILTTSESIETSLSNVIASKGIFIYMTLPFLSALIILLVFIALFQKKAIRTLITKA